MNAVKLPFQGEIVLFHLTPDKMGVGIIVEDVLESGRVLVHSFSDHHWGGSSKLELEYLPDGEVPGKPQSNTCFSAIQHICVEASLPPGLQPATAQGVVQSPAISDPSNEPAVAENPTPVVADPTPPIEPSDQFASSNETAPSTG